MSSPPLSSLHCYRQTYRYYTDRGIYTKSTYRIFYINTVNIKLMYDGKVETARHIRNREVFGDREDRTYP